MLEWTEDLQAATPPFRGDGVAPKATKKIDAAKLFGPIATALAPHRAPTYRPRASLVKFAATGEGSIEDEADAIFLLTSVGQKGPFKGEITMVPEADGRKVVNAAIDRAVQQGGVAHAFAVFLRIGAWKPYELLSTNQAMMLARVRLRQWLAHAPDADHAAALARAQATDLGEQKHWTRGRDAMRGEVLSYLFPDHRPFFDDVVARMDKDDWTSLLMASVMTIEDVEKLGPRMSDWRHALVLVRSLREAALPLLIERTKTRPDPDEVAQALAAFSSPDAATALAAFIESKPAHKLLAAYYAKHPAWGRDALTPIATAKDRKKPVRDAAAKLLATLD